MVISDHILKHRKVRQKYYMLHMCTFTFLLGVWKCQKLLFHIWHITWNMFRVYKVLRPLVLKGWIIYFSHSKPLKKYTDISETQKDFFPYRPPSLRATLPNIKGCTLIVCEVLNWRPSCKKGVYRILADFHFLQDRANFWQTDLFWHGKHHSVIVSVDLRFVLQK